MSAYQQQESEGENVSFGSIVIQSFLKSEDDYQAHMDFVHFNPIKHALVKQVANRPYSTFHKLVEGHVYPDDRAGENEMVLGYED
jgi:putative transposase